MKLFYFLTAVVICCWAFSCGEEFIGQCEEFQLDLLELDVEKAGVQINFWLADLQPLAVGGGNTSHEQNLGIFAERLQENCSLQADIECYACIETFPPQSHFTVHLDSAGTEVRRTLDILTPPDTVMTLRSIHY